MAQQLIEAAAMLPYRSLRDWCELISSHSGLFETSSTMFQCSPPAAPTLHELPSLGLRVIPRCGVEYIPCRRHSEAGAEVILSSFLLF